MIKKDEIIFLFGAGVSADAGIPTSSEMIQRVEYLIKTNEEWFQFKNLYYLIKSGIQFLYTMQGKDVIFNIKTLLNTLIELEERNTNPLYPFIGSWSIRFSEVIDNNFDLIKRFRKKIIEQLKLWMQPSNLQSSSYLRKLKDFKKEINFPIRIFTLNYDSLIEYNLGNVLRIEKGFDKDGKWNYKRFTEYGEEPDIYLYKLHGSIYWQRDERTKMVIEKDFVSDEPELIFGIQHNLVFGTQCEKRLTDPYLFMLSEFRHYCLNAKLIVSLGYSFSDEHINSILHQSILNNNTTKIFALVYKESPEKICQIIPRDRIEIVNNKNAKTFFEKDLKLETFKKFFDRVQILYRSK